jgi:hypothetical protein
MVLRNVIALTNQRRAEEQSRRVSEGVTPFDITGALKSLGETEYESEQARQNKEAERRKFTAENLLASDFPVSLPVRLPDTQERNSFLSPKKFKYGGPSVSVPLPQPSSVSAPTSGLEAVGAQLQTQQQQALSDCTTGISECSNIRSGSSRCSTTDTATTST